MPKLADLTRLQVVQLFHALGIKNAQYALEQKNLSGEDICFVETIDDLNELELGLFIFQLKRLLAKIIEWKAKGVSEQELQKAEEIYNKLPEPENTDVDITPEPVATFPSALEKPSRVEVEIAPSKDSGPPRPIDTSVNKPIAKEDYNNSSKTHQAKEINDSDRKVIEKSKSKQRGQRSAKSLSDGSSRDPKENHATKVSSASSVPLLASAPDPALASTIAPSKTVNPISTPAPISKNNSTKEDKVESSKSPIDLTSDSKEVRDSKMSQSSTLKVRQIEPTTGTIQQKDKGVIAQSSTTGSGNQKPSLKTLSKTSNQSSQHFLSLSSKKQIKTDPPPAPSTTPSTSSSGKTSTINATTQHLISLTNKRLNKYNDPEAIINIISKLPDIPDEKRVEKELVDIIADAHQQVKLLSKLLEGPTIELLIKVLSMYHKRNVTPISINIMGYTMYLVMVTACNEQYSKRDAHRGMQQLKDSFNDFFTLFIDILNAFHGRSALLVVSCCKIIKSFQHNEDCIKKIRKASPYSALSASLIHYQDHIDIIPSIGHAIACLGNDFESNYAFFQAPCLPIMKMLLEKHADRGKVIEFITFALCSLTYCNVSHKDEFKLDHYKAEFGSDEGIKLLIGLLEQYQQQERILQHITRLLTNLLYVESNMKLFGKEQGCKVLIQVLELNQRNVALVDEMCLCIINASFLPENIPTFHKQSNACTVLIAILQLHSSQEENAYLIEHVCQALTNLTTYASHQAVAVESNACVQLISVLNTYAPLKHLTVVEQCCRAITNIANRPDGQEQFGLCQSCEIMIQLLKQQLNDSITRLAAKSLANFIHHPANEGKINLDVMTYTMNAIKKYQKEKDVVEECIILLALIVNKVRDFMIEQRSSKCELLVALLQKYIKQSLMVESFVIVLDHACNVYDNVSIFITLELPQILLKLLQMYVSLHHPVLVFHTIHALQNMSKYPEILRCIANHDKHKVDMKFFIAMLKQYEEYVNVIETTAMLFNLLLCSEDVPEEDVKKAFADNQSIQTIMGLMKKYWNKAKAFDELISIILHVIELDDRMESSNTTTTITTTNTAGTSAVEIMMENESTEKDDSSAKMDIADTPSTNTALPNADTLFLLQQPVPSLQVSLPPSSTITPSTEISNVSTPSTSTTTTTTIASNNSYLSFDFAKMHENLLQSLKFHYKHLNVHLLLSIGKVLKYMYKKQITRDQKFAESSPMSSFASFASLFKAGLNTMEMTTTSNLGSRRSLSSLNTLASSSQYERKVNRVTFSSFNTHEICCLLLEMMQESCTKDDLITMISELLLLLLQGNEEEIPSWIGTIGGIKIILNTISFYKDEASIVLLISQILQRLLHDTTNVQIILQSDGKEVLNAVLLKMRKQAALLQPAGINGNQVFEEMKVAIEFDTSQDLPCTPEDEEQDQKKFQLLQNTVNLVKELLEQIEKHQKANPYLTVTLPQFQKQKESEAPPAETETSNARFITQEEETREKLVNSSSNATKKRRLKSYADDHLPSQSQAKTQSQQSPEVIDLL